MARFTFNFLDIKRFLMILRRYVLREHLFPFAFSFSVIMFLLVIDLVLQMLDRLLGKGIPAGAVLELFFLNTAWMVALAVPMAVLVSVLLAFGRLSGEGEIRAMRAVGAGVHQVIWPVLLAGAVLGGGLVWFNDRVLPEFNHRARLLMMDIHRKRPTVAIADKAGVVIGEFPDYRMVFDHADRTTGSLRQIRLYHFDGESYPALALADSGVVEFDLARDEALLELFNGEMHRLDASDSRVFIRTRFARSRLRLGEAGRHLSRSVSSYRNDREMGIGMMRDRIAEYRVEIDRIAADAGRETEQLFEQALLGTGLAQPERDVRSLLGRGQADLRILHHKRRAIDRLLVEIHKKYSIPAACFVFVLVGAPLGIRSRGSSPALGAGISIGFFLVWWIFLIGGEKLADRGAVAPWLAMWAPNLVTAVIGAGLTARQVFDWPIRRR